MKDVELYAKVRHAVRIEGLSRRAVARRFGIDPRTVGKMLEFSVPPGYRRSKPPVKPKLGPFIGIIDVILAEDKGRPKKQQHTSKRIFERLRDEHGFTGGMTIVKDYVALCARRHRLRCRQAFGVVSNRAPAAPPRHDDLSLFAESYCRDHFGYGLHGPVQGSRGMTDTPQVLLAHHLKALKLPTFLREYDKLARQCAAEGTDYPRYLLRLAELELIERERRMVERRIKAAKFPAVKSLDSFDFAALPSLNKALVMELARSEYIERRENIIAIGNSGTGKSHIALGLGLAACQKSLSVSFTTAAALVHELIEARDDKRLLRLQRQLVSHKLLIVDELGYVPLSQTGAELLFEVFSQRYERGSIIVTSNLPFDEWTSMFGSERLTGALLDRLTHHVHILEMNGESYRLAQSKRRSRRHSETPLIQTTTT